MLRPNESDALFTVILGSQNTQKALLHGERANGFAALEDGRATGGACGQENVTGLIYQNLGSSGFCNAGVIAGKRPKAFNGTRGATVPFYDTTRGFFPSPDTKSVLFQIKEFPS